ncbi:MAG TPA: MBL fold metallo-hydrolase [Candidatus Angelobacter sp.]|nr:MBL fold metallo-hydrolase [Candidatus Angelobacter sp.]
MERWPFGVLPPGGLERLGPHTIAYYATGYPYSNSAIVLGKDGVLVFDANIFHYARELKTALTAEWPGGAAQLVISHSHADHADGAMYFSPPAQTLASKFAQGRLAWWRAQDQTARNSEYVDQYPNAAAWYRDFRMVVPERAVARRELIDLGGGVRVQLVPEAVAHTPGDLWAVVEPDGVGLCGDLWFNDCEPYLGSGSIEGSLDALDRLRAAGARTYLPGHGRAGMLQRNDPMVRYCLWVLEHVAAGMSRGLAGEQLRQAIRAEFDAQDARPGEIRFAITWKGALEDAVEAAEMAARGEPLYRNVQVVDIEAQPGPTP